MLVFLLLSLSLFQGVEASPPREISPLELSPEMRSFLDRTVDRGLAETERLHALASAVFRDRELSFTYAPETRTAIETFENRSGNCLSLTILFIAMARYVGLDARFREVEIAPVWSRSGTFVNLNEHINAAVIIGGNGYVVDVFPGVNPLEIGGTLVSDSRGLAHFYNNKGVAELGRGNLRGAESCLRKALEFDPGTVSVWINLGAAKAQAQEFGAAESCYRKALEIDRGNLAAMSNLAVVCQRTGRHSEAEKYLKKVREFREKNPYHHYALGMQAYDAGRYEESIAHFKKALKLKSREHNFYFALARAYAQLRLVDEVLENLQLAVKYAPSALKKDQYSHKLELLQSRRRDS